MRESRSEDQERVTRRVLSFKSMLLLLLLHHYCDGGALLT